MFVALRHSPCMKCHAITLMRTTFMKTRPLLFNDNPAQLSAFMNVRLLCQEKSSSGKKMPISLKYNEDNYTRMTSRERLKRAFKEYGPALVVVHISIALMSVGSFYLLLSYGVDPERFVSIDWLTSSQSKVVAGTGTFVVAYAFHKAIMPVRIALTLFLTPVLVRALRARGILRGPK